jgi:magnesium-protoporphyrin O-methyltransferase
MSYCQCEAIELETIKWAKLDLKRYRDKGPDKTTAILLNFLKEEGVKGLTLLDIGGGVGAIHHELLKYGMRHAANVEASTAYIEAAKDEAERRGLTDRIQFYHGDFVELAEDVPLADIVTLDRVICCYDDAKGLVNHSAAHTHKFLGLVYPRVTWWAKILLILENFYYRIRKSPFRTFLHATESVDAIIRANGLTPKRYHKTLMWQVVVYAR